MAGDSQLGQGLRQLWQVFLSWGRVFVSCGGCFSVGVRSSSDVAGVSQLGRGLRQ